MIYRAKEPLLAVRDDVPKPNGFITISPGSIISTRGEVQQSGFVDVLYDGRVVAVFMRDIQARTDRVEDKTTS
jgi:hypothetical protein